jgi:hypothetical protein
MGTVSALAFVGVLVALGIPGRQRTAIGQHDEAKEDVSQSS